jgi:hypothetical protein
MIFTGGIGEETVNVDVDKIAKPTKFIGWTTNSPLFSPCGDTTFC